MVLCDTNIFIEIYRRNDAVRSIVRDRIGYDSIAVSDVTRAELFYGAFNRKELQMISKDLSNMSVMHIDQSISIMAVDMGET
jgi:predicted nucleic acid-binding protein